MLTLDGLASGMDTKTVIAQLMALEQRPVQLYQQRKTDLETFRTAWKDVNTRMLTLLSRVEALDQAQDFAVVKATSSDKDALTVAAETDAPAGTYRVSVARLASAQVATSAGQAGDWTAAVAGDFYLNGTKITVAAGDGLADIRDKINGQSATIGVTASVIQSGANQFKLVLTSSKTGVGAGITSVQDDAGVASAFGLISGGALNEVQAGDNAELTINGVTVTSASNTVDAAIPGVKMTLIKPATDINISVATDVDAIVGSIKALVDQYNSTTAFIQDKQTYDKEKKSAGTLLGDQTATGILRDLRYRMTDRISSVGADDYHYLADIGITSGKYGTADFGRLTVDETKLREALQNKPEQVIALFTSSDGVATKLKDYVEGYTKSLTGVLPKKDKELERQLKDMETRLTAMTDRLATREEYYKARFVALETALSKLRDQQSWLTSQIASLE
ncbi:MAG: flagellar filament capping protein FliD [Chloroflexota bacterium]